LWSLSFLKQFFIKSKRNEEFESLKSNMYVKVKVKQSYYRPGVAQRFQEVKVPRFHDNCTGWW